MCVCSFANCAVEHVIKAGSGTSAVSLRLWKRWTLRDGFQAVPGQQLFFAAEMVDFSTHKYN
jgi:hypothetical protein